MVKMAKKRKTGSRGREMTVRTSGFHVKGEKEESLAKSDCVVTDSLDLFENKLSFYSVMVMHIKE